MTSARPLGTVQVTEFSLSLYAYLALFFVCWSGRPLENNHVAVIVALTLVSGVVTHCKRLVRSGENRLDEVADKLFQGLICRLADSEPLDEASCVFRS
jgi:hypothetical protein